MKTTGAAGGVVERDVFGALPDGRAVERFTLRDPRGITVQLGTRGAAILSIRVPDREGSLADVTLGYRTLGQYLDDRAWTGALIGRYANRIAGGRFTLDGREYVLPLNDPPNHLHGGIPGNARRARHLHADGGRRARVRVPRHDRRGHAGQSHPSPVLQPGGRGER
jgi:aldose 1-epimerase